MLKVIRSEKGEDRRSSNERSSSTGLIRFRRVRRGLQTSTRRRDHQVSASSEQSSEVESRLWPPFEVRLSASLLFVEVYKNLSHSPRRGFDKPLRHRRGEELVSFRRVRSSHQTATRRRICQDSSTVMICAGQRSAASVTQASRSCGDMPCPISPLSRNFSITWLNESSGFSSKNAGQVSQQVPQLVQS